MDELDICKGCGEGLWRCAMPPDGDGMTEE